MKNIKELDELVNASIGIPLGDIIQSGRDTTPQPISPEWATGPLNESEGSK